MAFHVTTEVKVRFSDTDALGHCNNAKYFSYMEEGRSCYFRKLYPGLNFSENPEDFPFILGEISARFIAPTFMGDELIVGLGVTKFGNKSFGMDYEIIKKDTQDVVATGTSTLVMFDYKLNQSVPVTDELKEKVRKIENNDQL